jgi:hypothetical protein
MQLNFACAGRFLMACAAAYLTCVPLAAAAATPAPDLDARFASAEGWLGADGIYSVALPGGRTAWIFSDTWTGILKEGRRAQPRMINNSVGITEGTGTARFYYPTNAAGKAATLFTPPDGRGWYWPVAPVLDKGVLHLFAWRIEKTEGGGAFGFKAVGTAHTGIDNPSAEPTAWHQNWQDLPMPQTRPLFWGSCALAYNGYTYLYGYTENGEKGLAFQRHMLLARAPSGKLSDFASWRFYARGAWLEDVAQAETLCPSVACEYTVTYIPARKRFLFVTHDMFLSPKIITRTAENPWGPWSDKREIYDCPEASGARGVFCYAAKHQPIFSDDATLVFSYAANGHEMKTVLNDPSLYVPRFIRVPVAEIFK